MVMLETATRHTQLETRQYEILGKDLGQGVRRVALLLGAAVFVAWATLMWLFGVPLHTRFAVVFLLPPALIVHSGLRPDASERQLVAVGWLWLLRYSAVDRWSALFGLRPAPREHRARVTAAPRIRATPTSTPPPISIAR